MFLVGKIVGTHGIKGELKVKSYTDFNEVRFGKEQTLYIKFHNAYQEDCVHSYREHKGHVLVAFTDLLDINKVEKYIGCEDTLARHKQFILAFFCRPACNPRPSGGR